MGNMLTRKDNKPNRLIFCGCLVLLLFLCSGTVVYSAVNNTYEETFDGRLDGATIHDVDSWSVDVGDTDYIITQSTPTFSGTGNILRVIGNQTTGEVSRLSDYGSCSPCWVEFIVNPAAGAESRDVPSGKIASVSFDCAGYICASDGDTWVNTGVAYSDLGWYKIILKLDFSTHLYDIYISPVATPEVSFIPDKEDLSFTDDSINSLGELGFAGVYNTNPTDDDTHLDDVVVHFVEKLEVINAFYSVAVGQTTGPITVQLQNALSEAQTAWKDITLQLSTSSSKGSFSLDATSWTPVSQVVILEGGQEATFYYVDGMRGKPTITVSEYPDSGWTDATQTQEIMAAVAYFNIAVESYQTAGEYFSATITAMNDEGGVNENYSGSIDLSVSYIYPTSGTMGITPTSVSGFVNGRAETNLIYPDCGVVQIVVRDTEDTSKIGASGEVLFIPASLNVSCASPQIVNRDFDLSITAYNALGAITPNYKGPATLSVVPVTPGSVSGASISPSSIGTEYFNGGTAEVSVRYNRWGNIKIEASDEEYSSQGGISEEVSFQPKDILVEVIPASDTREFFYTGENIEIDISAIDENKQPIPNYTGKVAISTMQGLVLPGEYQFLDEDNGIKSFIAVADSPGLYVVEAEEAAIGLVGKSPNIEVKEATIVVTSTVAPIGTAEITITLVDEEGNIISSESGVSITVDLEEELPNGSALSNASVQAVTFSNGVVRILVSNTQSEVVTILPKSTYRFKIKKGTVRFGRIAKTGIGMLMWREIKGEGLKEKGE